MTPVPPAPLVLSLGDEPSRRVTDVVAASTGVPGLGVDVDATLARSVSVGSDLYSGGRPSYREVWEVLANTALQDVAAARILEPHLDALAILSDAESPELTAIDADAGSTWGVFAAEGRGMRLEATRDGDAWSITGTKPWCSLAGRLSHALVTAHLDGGERGLFAVDLRSTGVSPHDGPWVARGLSGIVSAAVDFDAAAAVPVGGPGWYLERPGFAWGGIGVAACWWGGAIGLLEWLAAAASATDDPLTAMHLGAADAALWGARATLADAADRADGRTGIAPTVIAGRARSVVATAVEQALLHSAHGLGPGPLTSDEAYARRVADLQVYVRQHHAERDDASLGRKVAAGGTLW